MDLIMKKIIILVLSSLILSGCATYKFEKGLAPYDQGYVVAKDNKVIPEYTVGKDDAAPNLETAEARFNRRKKTVESYYEKMGYMKSRAREMFIDPPVMMGKFIVGFFRLPAIAVHNYKYNHNPQYREMVTKEEDEKFEAERKRVDSLKQELNGW